MINGVLLAVIAGSTMVNGLFLDRIPPWRQALFAALVLLAYLHGRHRPVRRAGVLLGAVALAAAGYAVADFAAGSGALLAYGVFALLPWLAGRFRSQQAALVRAGAERVAHLEREQRFVAEHARLVERARIAADMHDELGHELALIALRAGALELAPDLTEDDREAAAQLRASAVTAADRLRHTVTGLRAAPDPAAGPSVEALVGRARDAGLTVRLTGDVPVRGSAAVRRAVHRVVQEALTNATRHAPGAAVDVRLGHGGDVVTVTVRNPVAGAPRPSGAGSGLAGLRRQVGRLGGTLRVDAGRDEFTVTAELPAAATGEAGPR